MSRFDDMAKQAKAEHDRAEADRQAQLKRESDERQAAFNKAALDLLNNVLPIFEEAKRAFDASGAPSHIRDNWRQETYGQPLRPEITFQCVGPKTRNSVGGSYETRSPAVFASYDGQTYRVGIADSSYTNSIGKDSASFQTFDGAIVEGYLEKAIKRFLEDDTRNRTMNR